MDLKDETRNGNHPGKRVRFLDRNIVIFAFFLVLSFVFWYLNSLGKDIEADIKYPVSYINIPGNKILSGGAPSRLNLFLKGSGYSILRLKISGTSKPVSVDFSRISYRRLQNSKPNDYFIVSSGLVQSFNTQLKSACKITSVKPDTLFFSLTQPPK